MISADSFNSKLIQMNDRLKKEAKDKKTKSVLSIDSIISNKKKANSVDSEVEIIQD